MLAPDLEAKLAHAHTTSEPNAAAAEPGYRNMAELLRKNGTYYDTKPYLIYFDLNGNRIEYNYKDFFMLAQQCANLLLDHGIHRGDRIATISHNHADTVIQYFAAWLVGACVVPVSLSEDDHRITYILEHSHAKLAFLRADYAERIHPLTQSIPSLEHTIICGEPATDVAHSLPNFDALLAETDPFFTSPEAVTAQDEALIVYTSGTTGNPKGVVLTQYNLLIDAKAIAEWFDITNAQRTMCVLPIHHVNGTVVTLVTPMYAGATAILNQKFQSETFFQRLRDERVNVVSVVPTLLAFLIEYFKAHPELRGIADATTLSLRHLICGAGPLTVELGQAFEEMFHIPIDHGYGLSESTCYSCFLPTDLDAAQHAHWMRSFGFPSIGVALAANEMMIADDNGNPLPPGEKGEIAIRGFNIMKHYYENDEANASTFKYGWFRSGDEGLYQPDDTGRNFFFITGRLKELIIRGGVNISPLEIDEVLAKHPSIKSAIAVGFENDFYGEEVGAYVELLENTTATEEDIIAHCRTMLPFSKSPKVVVFGNDIPVTSTGKYQRNKCKPLFKAWQATQFRKEK